jgi:hypothetical protein
MCIRNVRKEVKLMRIGTNVIFNGENYTIRWLYNNGKCEIKKQNGSRQVELVSLSELEVIGKTIEYC